MSLETYKALNKEMALVLQEYRTIIINSQKELVIANNRFFDEHQKRIEEGQKYKQFWAQLKKKLNTEINEAFLLCDSVNSFNETVASSQRPTVVESRSSGVVARSPIIRQSIENSEETEGTNKVYGFTVIAEVSPRTDENYNSSTDAIVEGTNTLQAVASRRNRRQTLDFTNRITVTNCEQEDDEETVLAMSNLNLNTIVNTTLDRLTVDFARSSYLHSTPKTSFDLSDETDAKSQEENTTSENSTSSRPRRNCAPKNLTETSVRSKLRNENSYKPKGSKSKKPKKCTTTTK